MTCIKNVYRTCKSKYHLLSGKSRSSVKLSSLYYLCFEWKFLLTFLKIAAAFINNQEQLEVFWRCSAHFRTDVLISRVLLDERTALKSCWLSNFIKLIFSRPPIRKISLGQSDGCSYNTSWLVSSGYFLKSWLTLVSLLNAAFDIFTQRILLYIYIYIFEYVLAWKSRPHEDKT